MNFEKSDIQTMLLDSAERLLAQTSGIEYWREQRHGLLGFEQDRWAKFAELGWLALPVPEDAGGLNGSMEDVALLNVALGKALSTEPYVSTAVLGEHIIAQAAGEQAEALLGEIAGGELRLALAYLENGADPLSMTASQTVARASGNGYVLNGAKIIALDAPSADKLIVSAGIEGQEGVALFLIDADQQGVDSKPYPLIDGTRAADVTLTEVSVGSDALLVDAAAGAKVLREAIDRASVALMGQAVGAMEAANQICADYVKQRKQFGVAIGSFQAIQHIMADMFVAAHQARSMLYYALANIEQDEEARGAALSAARIVIGDASQLVSRMGVQVHGGYGLTDEYAISHYFRRLMCIEKLFGDITGHTEQFAAGVLG